MKPSKLALERISRGVKLPDMAKAVGMTYGTYRNKERGVTRFTSDEIVSIAKFLALSLSDINDLFFDGKIDQSGTRVARFWGDNE